MTRNTRQWRFALVRLVALAASFSTSAGVAAAPETSSTPAGSTPGIATPSQGQRPLRIEALLDGATHGPASGQIRLNRTLRVVLNRAPTFSADHYALLLNGSEVKGVASAFDGTEGGAGQAPVYWLDFKLQRSSDNDAFWRSLLGSPKRLTVPVIVSLRETPPACTAGQADCSSTPILIRGEPGAVTFNLVAFSAMRLAVAVAAILAVIIVVWGHARSRATLRDNLLPQLEPSLQPYSLGRSQMALWFTLVFSAFIFLFVLLGDYNTITAQSVLLMGISSATALASVAVDAAKDSPADAANRGLKALGLASYADVERVRQEITDREDRLRATPPPSAAQRAHWQGEIQDRHNILRLYQDKCRPFRTEGWLKDVTTDFNGTAVHRVQIVCWTALLGVVFVIGVYTDLAMPQFSGMVLALLGVSGAGYVGFKYPESNN
jgi:hypothetical protein